jgi:hypothetical protein
MMLSLTHSAEPQEERAGVVGTYAFSDAFASVEVTIKSDGTFKFTGHGCVSTNVTEGTWRLVAPGLVVANSEGTPPVSEIRAAVDPSLEKLTFSVTHTLGEPLPGATVTVTCSDGGTHETLTRAGGTAVLDRCPVAEISVAFVGFETATLSPERPMANQFFVTMKESAFLLRDQLWYVHDGNLYQLEHPLVRE